MLIFIHTLIFQLEIPPSSEPCIGPCPLLGRRPTSSHLESGRSTAGQAVTSQLDQPSLLTPTLLNPSFSMPGKSTNFSLTSNPLNPSILSTQPAAVTPENRQSRNFAPKTPLTPLRELQHDGHARQQGETGKSNPAESMEVGFVNTTSSPMAKWVAQVIFTLSSFCNCF